MQGTPESRRARLNFDYILYMKPNFKIVAVTTFLAISVCANAQERFLRPEVSYNFAKSSDSTIDLKDAVGFGIAGGIYFGAQNGQELGLSAGILNFDIKSVEVGGVDVTGRVKALPLLVTYRYYLGTNEKPLRFYLASAVGYSIVKVEATASLGDVTAAGDSNETDFTWAVGTGAVFKLSDRIDMDAGYRFQQIRQADGHASVNSIYVGANLHF
jgi:opacity protein-like surface antigen